MADQKITQLTENTTPLITDLLPTVKDPGGSPVTDKLQIGNLPSGLNVPEGFLFNGKISVTVSSNNITVAIKGMNGSDPSSSNPVWVRINGTMRVIISALSVTKNAGTNWFNSGSSELATNEIDYFVYLGYNSTDGVVIGFSRIPYATQYGDFSSTSTNDYYCAISTTTNAASTDYYNLIGRFAATLSATSSFNWSIPTFTAANLIQHPIYQTRVLTMSPTLTGYSANPTNQTYTYCINYKTVVVWGRDATAGTSNSSSLSLKAPITAQTVSNAVWMGTGKVIDNGVTQTTEGQLELSSGSNTINVYRDPSTANNWTSSGSKGILGFRIDYPIG